MIKLDDNLLQEIGLGALSPDDKKKMLAHIYETLEMRVGMELAKQMSDAQLSEFEEFINRNDEPGALRWLESNFPNYKDVVAAEFQKLKNEIHQVSPQILASSQQQAQAMQQPQPQYPQQPQSMPMQSPMPGQQPQPQYAPYPQQPQPVSPNPQQPYPYAPQQQPMQPPMPAAPGYGQPQQQPYPPQYPPQPQPPQQPGQPDGQNGYGLAA